MRQYLRVYKKLLRLNWEVVMEYRASFIMGTFSTVMWGFLNLAQMYVLTFGSGSIYGWSRNDLVLLTILFNIILGIFHFLFSRNFNRFSELIHYGQLDTLLTKPIDSQFLISTHYIRYPNLFRCFIMGVYGIYVYKQTQYAISAYSLLFLCIFILFGLVVMYSIWMIVCTFIIWFTKLTNLVDLLYFLNLMSRYPREMFSEFSTYVLLTVLPFTFIAIPATRAIIHKITLFDSLGLMLMSGLLFIISRGFWKYALRHYTSANG